MAVYTTQLRSICESIAEREGLVGYSDVADVIATARPSIFNFNYPIFDEDYRPVLETKIIKHFYTREIGLETYGLWKLKLDTKLNEIMPYYNEMYRSTKFEYDPLMDTNITKSNGGTRKESGNVKTIGSNSGNSTVTTDADSTVVLNGNDIVKNSNTPQGGIDGLESGKYMSSASIDKVDNTTTTNTGGTTTGESGSEYDDTVTRDLTTTDEYTEKVIGKSGIKSYSQYIVEFREAIINVDMMIIEELEELFMLIY